METNPPLSPRLCLTALGSAALASDKPQLFDKYEENKIDPEPGEGGEVAIEIGGMSCATCAGRVERALKAVPGVTKAEVNLASEHARVRFASGRTPQPDALIEAVTAAGYDARVIDIAHPPAALPPQDRAKRRKLADIRGWMGVRPER
jgi:copper chaperone CopZ